MLDKSFAAVLHFHPEVVLTAFGLDHIALTPNSFSLFCLETGLGFVLLIIASSNTDASQALFFGRDPCKKGYRISDLSSWPTILSFEMDCFRLLLVLIPVFISLHLCQWWVNIIFFL